MPRQWKHNTINMNTCCVPRLGRSTATLPSSTSMRPLRTCSFSRPCASAQLFFFFLLCVLPLHFCSTFPFICPIISSPLFYKLRWEAGLQEITWVLTHSLFAATHRRMELTSNIISPRAIHNSLSVEVLKLDGGYMWLHCLPLDPFPLTGLPCLAWLEEDACSPTVPWYAKTGWYPWKSSPFLRRKREGVYGGHWEG